LPRGVLEQREQLEQLRALEAGMRISVSLIDAAQVGVQVDTAADLARARQLMEQMQ
jgi:3-deoxy-manno-octulosonate cytidylyltransferase (CMP-KDO synthetase)